jgi:hypothetical protein
MLRSLDLENNHENQEGEHPFDSFQQSTTAWAIRSTILQTTSCQLMFGRDMIHNIAFRENWN